LKKTMQQKSMFILLFGIVEVRKEGELLAIVTPGGVIGEIAFVPCTASIITATKDVRVLGLDEASLSRLFKLEGKLANKVLVNLCRSLCIRIIQGGESADLRAS